MIDYGVLPPEINSTRMHTGAGSGPMLAAAAAWDTLADELSTTGAWLESTVLDLIAGPWRGPSSLAMAAAALPFAAWFNDTAAQAAQSAAQAKAAAAAFEAAFAMTVHPHLVFANRAQLMALIATNFFGQNTPAIAATEAHYGAMWAQDAAAMYGYLGGSSAASRFSDFTSPPQTTSPGVQPAPAAPDTASAAAGTGSAAPGTGVTAPGTLLPPPPPGAQEFVNGLTTFTGYANSALGVQRLGDMTGQGLNGWEVAGGGYTGARDFLADAAKAAEVAAKAAGPATQSAGTAASRVPVIGGTTPSVTLARGVQIGGLSVPPSWPGAGGATNPVTLVSQITAATESEALPRAMFGPPGIPAAKAAGQVTGFRFVPRYGYRQQMMTRPPSAG